MSDWKHGSHLRIGLDHLADKQECQDAVLIGENEDCIAAALADGVGSLANSKLAAQVATRTTVRWLLEHGSGLSWDEDSTAQLRADLLMTVRGAIRDAAQENNMGNSTLDCNLAFVCILKQAGKLLLGQLGDCAVCLIGAKAEAYTEHSLSVNGTASVLGTQAVKDICLKWVDLEQEAIHSVILASDGLEREIYLKNSRRVRKTAENSINLVRLLDEKDMDRVLGQYFTELVYSKRDFNDDISIAVLTRASEKVVLPPDPYWLCLCGKKNEMYDRYCAKCAKELFAVYKDHYDYRSGVSLEDFFSEWNQDSYAAWDRLPMEVPRPESASRVLPKQDEKKQEDAVPKADTRGPAVKLPDPLPQDPQGKQNSGMENKASDENALDSGEYVGRFSREWKYRTQNQLAGNGAEEKHMPQETAEKKEVPDRNEMQPAPVGTGKQPDTEKSDPQGIPREPGMRKQASAPEPEVRGIGALSSTSPLRQVPVENTEPPKEEITEIQEEPPKNPVKEDKPKKKKKDKPSREPEKEEKKNPNREKNKPGKNPAVLLLSILCAAMAVAIVMLLLFRGGPESPYTWEQISRGSYYSGDMQDGKPHGSGILIKNGCYWIGQFSQGKMVGSFLVVSMDDPEEYEIRDTTPEESVPTEQSDVTQPRVPEGKLCDVISASVTLREEPGFKSRRTPVKLSQGDQVYQLEELEREVDGTVWIRVSTLDGQVGWCEKGSVEPVGEG